MGSKDFQHSVSLLVVTVDRIVPLDEFGARRLYLYVTGRAYAPIYYLRSVFPRAYPFITCHSQNPGHLPLPRPSHLLITRLSQDLSEGIYKFRVLSTSMSAYRLFTM